MIRMILDVLVERLATTLTPLRGPRTDAGTSLALLRCGWRGWRRHLP